MKKFMFVFLGLLIVSSMLLAACQPEANPTAAVQEEETEAAVEEPTSAPVAPESTEEEAAPAEETAVEAEGVKRVVYVENVTYTSLDPFITAWHPNSTYAIFATLWEYSPDLKNFSGILAESWSFAEDNLSATVILKEGLTFTDGTAVDAEAIKWNIDRYLDADLGSPGGGTLRQYVESVEVIDDLTFKINLITPFADLMDEMAWKEIVSPSAYETLGPEKYAEQLTSAGRFIVTKIIPDLSITLKKNPDFTFGGSYCKTAGSPMPFDELIVKYITDTDVAYAALEAGEVDIVEIPPQYLEQAEQNPNIGVVEAVSSTTYYLGFNNQFYPFTEEGVRQAIAYAVNREEINLIALEGAGRVLYQPLGPGVWGYNEELQEYGKLTSDDVDKANQMLDELGFLDTDGDGIREEPNGKKMEYELMYPNDVPERQLIAETLQSNLSDIGISTYLLVVDGTLIRQRTAEGTHQMFTWMYDWLTPSIITYVFHSSRIGASNRNHTNDPELDVLLEASDQELDPVKRQEAVDAVNIYLIDHRYHVPLVSPLSYTGYRIDRIDPQTIDILGTIWWCDIQVK